MNCVKIGISICLKAMKVCIVTSDVTIGIIDFIQREEVIGWNLPYVQLIIYFPTGATYLKISIVG